MELHRPLGDIKLRGDVGRGPSLLQARERFLLFIREDSAVVFHSRL